MDSSVPAPTHPPPPPPTDQKQPPSQEAAAAATTTTPGQQTSLHYYSKSFEAGTTASPPTISNSPSWPLPEHSTPTPPPSYNDITVSAPPPAEHTARTSLSAPSYAPPPPPVVEPQTPLPPQLSQVQYDSVPARTLTPPAPEASVTMLSEQPQGSVTVEKTRGREWEPRKDSLGAVPKPNAAPVSSPLPVRQDSPSEADLPRGRSISAQPQPSSSSSSAGQVLQPGVPASSQPNLLGAALPDATTRSRSAHARSGSASTSQRRHTWLRNRSRSNSQGPMAAVQSTAWVLAPDSRAEYNVNFLANGEVVPELWDDSGTLYVYLSPRDSGKGASFKVRASIVDQSRVLSELAASELLSPVSARSRARSFGGRDSLTAADAVRVSSPAPSPPLEGDGSRLHLPVATDANGGVDLERLIAVRNLFALLTGQPLVATRANPTAFAALMQVAALLREFDFGYGEGSVSFGEAVDVSLGFYIDLNGLADVRTSREKTLEALVLGEHLRFWPLYNEAFCHAVGKYPALRDLKTASSLWDQVSTNTRLRLERAHLDLVSRQHSVNTRLEQFDFPSLFSGVANSTSNEEYRNLRFKNWRTAFIEMRSFVHKYYKTEFGSWPPKASSRRNPFTESGLNRLVLKTLYADLCSLYDLLVDRTSFTPRVGEDGGVPPPPPAQSSKENASKSSSSGSTANAEPPLRVPALKALRQILAEFDQSSPPVLPAMPFDIPKVPTMATIRETYPNLSAKDQARFDKSVQSYELQLILLKSHNVDAERLEESPFLAAYEAFELREAKRGKSEAEILEMRIGHWLFLYVVLQSMPMLVVEAPGLTFVDGVEYFLCEPPQGRPPWVEDAGEVRKAWFQTAGGSGHLVELSADVLLYSVEATYHRSHCWLAAKKWEAEASMAVAPDELVMVPGGSRQDPETERPRTAAAFLGFGLGDSADGLDPASQSLSIPGMHSRARSTSAASSSVPNLPSLASLAAAEASGSSTSSPQLPPLSFNDETSSNPSPRSQSPALLAQQQGRPPLQPLSMAPPPRRANYLELQQRANLRHASIGWALEPVSLGDDEAFPGGMPPPRGHFRGAEANTRRVASAGNLRSMMDTPPGSSSGGGGVRTGSGSGPSHSQNQGLLVPSPDAFVNTGSTFDSILGSMDNQKKAKNRKSFLPF